MACPMSDIYHYSNIKETESGRGNMAHSTCLMRNPIPPIPCINPTSHPSRKTKRTREPFILLANTAALGLMALSMGLYLVGWQHATISGQRKEAARVEALRAGGFLQLRQEETEGEKRGSRADEEEEEREERREEIEM